YRVIVNRAIDHRRRPQNDDIDAIAEPASDAPDAVSVLHRRQVTRRLRQAQEKLPEQQRVAVTLYYFEGLNASDVAVVMGVSLGAVESLLKRARQNLRQSLKASAQAVRDSFDDG
ncbi:sigma-70 family RNA polymerase sigma factor, partial [bacterium]|nr:sigma-70 family RNA polymerase sigma factor [bacterium]